MVGIIGSIAGWIFKEGLAAVTKSGDNRVKVIEKTIDGAVTVEVAQADERKTKYQIPWFWLLAAMFIVPLAFWWTMVIADSIFNFPFSISNLPTPEMRQWAGEMIKFLFYTGTTVAGIKALTR